MCVILTEEAPAPKLRARSASAKQLISPRLTDTSRRVVLHREYDRLTNYANQVFVSSVLN